MKYRKGRETVIETFIASEVFGDCNVGFGLSVTMPGGEVIRLDSLTFDRAAIEELSDRINRLGVSRTHLYEILEDFLE